MFLNGGRYKTEWKGLRLTSCSARWTVYSTGQVDVPEELWELKLSTQIPDPRIGVYTGNVICF